METRPSKDRLRHPTSDTTSANFPSASLREANILLEYCLPHAIAMARRSARLQKRSLSNSSWVSAQSNLSTHEEQDEPLVSVTEQSEPESAAKSKTPSKPKSKKRGNVAPTSAQKLLSPAHSRLSTDLLANFSASTPDSTPIKPPAELMHPALFHPSTAKMSDEARWARVEALGAHTAPAKGPDGREIGEATPSKVPSKMAAMSSPDYKFSFKAPVSAPTLPPLTPSTRRILEELDAKRVAEGGRSLFRPDEFAGADTPARKVAVPKGKASRFSNAHMAEFKKMDSIANHPSAFRADPSRAKPVTASLQRTPTREASAKTPNKLKRTQSKMDLNEAFFFEPQAEKHMSKPAATPLKRAQTKDETPGSKLPRSTSTVRLVAPSRNGASATAAGEASAKRVRRTKEDDAASTRPVSRDAAAAAAPTPARRLPAATSRLMTPTKASLLRSQSAKAIRNTKMLPSLFRSPSTKTEQPTTSLSEAVKEGIRKTNDSLQKMRSILRTPSRKFSDDPQKIAAGTHITPPALLAELPAPPKTAPVRKQVNFSNSTLEKATKDELLQSPSPVKLRATSVTLGNNVVYPALPTEEPQSPSRRMTFGGPTPSSMPFSFESNKTIKFGGAASGTIRMVPKAGVSASSDDKKRKLTSVEEVSDKENSEPAEETRSPKKLKMGPPATPKTASKLPRRTPKSAISKSSIWYEAHGFLDWTASGVDHWEGVIFTTPMPCHSRFSTALQLFLASLEHAPLNASISHPLLSSSAPPPSDVVGASDTSRLQRLLEQTGLFEFLRKTGVVEYLTNPRLDDPVYITSLALVLAAVFVTMSWFSRAGGSWGAGRFSPFGRSASNPPGSEITDGDFSYITNEDLAHHNRRRTSREIVDWDDSNPDRESDVLVFKHGRTNFPAHFPRGCIRDGVLKIKDVRNAAAKKLGVNDPRRIRMFSKGRNLKFDDRSAKEEGLRGDGSGSDILCVVGEAETGRMPPGAEDLGQQRSTYSEGEDDEEDDGLDGSGAAAGSAKKKKSRRGNRKRNKKTRTDESTPGLAYSSAQSTGAEFLPTPSTFNAPKPTPSPTPTPRANTPLTPMAKLDALASKFHTEFVPLCVQYMNSPPEDEAKRHFEYKKLSETILAQILLKLDGVEVDGEPEARARRKELVREVQGMLNRLDEVVKR
ncbi:hypothetical protein M011DRAFT_460585 [Sporormia fimetaria CBS 119925]|uniref:BAG domain-containing protein n=1 Tax=Sporormia fimetaria CBS 119925 TaxID=1340428 RepID=A0A6A6V655_9PLEO|nr:hypothetical protein M011DRAFT_460585 [Sporormia fimetaria CBS 119925]